MKKIIALIMAMVCVFSAMTISVYADGEEENTVTVTVNDIEFVFDADTTEEFRSKTIAHYFGHGNDGTDSYGLTCTLFGHKLENSITTAITHKASATDPRCLRQMFNTEVCTRCDYTNSTLINTAYISCC